MKRVENQSTFKDPWVNMQQNSSGPKVMRRYGYSCSFRYRHGKLWYSTVCFGTMMPHVGQGQTINKSKDRATQKKPQYHFPLHDSVTFCLRIKQLYFLYLLSPLTLEVKSRAF